MADSRSGVDPSVEKHRDDEGSRCAILIMKTEHGPWGIRIDSEGTIICRERPDYYPSRMTECGAVLIGVIRRADTRYEIIDAESTWRGLRSVMDRWYGRISESKLPSSISSREQP
jgi:hypothetical protein